MIENRKDIMWRVYLVYIAVLLFALIVIGRVFYIQVFEGDELRKKAAELTIDTLKVEAVRGDICADDGILLATSVPIFDIRVDFVSIDKTLFDRDVDSLAYYLSNLFKDKSKNEYKHILLKSKLSKERYFLLKRGINYAELKALRTFPILKGGRFKGGKIEIQNYRREMPYKTLAVRTIGFERKGIYVGLEGAYSKKLEGISGIALKQKIAGGVWMPIVDENQVEPQNGSDIITSINVNMQDFTENALMKSLIANNAHHGCAVVMEVGTGEIKAIANLTKNKQGTYEELYNYAIGESSEPGSTFKLASVMAAMEDGKIDLNDMVNTGNGVYTYFNQDMVDSHKGGYGTISLLKAFSASSNVGISKLIYQSYASNPQKFIDRLYSMRLNQPLGMEINGEAMPLIKDTHNSAWSRVSLPWMSVGYELSLTPMQILAFYNAVANDGKMMKPKLVNEIRRMGKTDTIFKPIVLKESICSKATINKAHILLEEVVKNGTARNIKSKNYKIAGKTGTAQVAKGKFGYKKENSISYKASFVGYFPADKPRYSCIVVVNNPTSGAYYGGSVAGPVFKEIADRIYALEQNIHAEQNDTTIENSYPIVKTGNSRDINIIYSSLNIHETLCDPKLNWVSASVKNKNFEYVDRTIRDGVVPNVIGMTAKDAVYLIEKKGLNVKLIGRGHVVSQSIRPGSPIRKGEKVILELTYKPTIDSAYIPTVTDTLTENQVTDTLSKATKNDKPKDKAKIKKSPKDVIKPKNKNKVTKPKAKTNKKNNH